MKHRKKRRLRNYMLGLFVIWLFVSLLIDRFINFFIGFFAGWNGLNSMETAKAEFGDLGKLAGWITIGILLSAGFLCYRQLKRKVTQPLEQLAESMQEVSRGNLEVKVPVNGDFELEGMQEAFNQMVTELAQAARNKERLQQKNQQLYAGIAHDLKTPMTMILGYAKLLEQENTLSAEDKKRYLKTIIEEIQHANALLDSMLAYSKLENQSYHLKKETKDIVECLRACVANYYPILEQAKVQIELLLPDKPILFCFDELEMKRTFTNLLANVVKHNPTDTACRIQLEEIALPERNETILRIVVADNGPKISADLQSILFDSFAVGDSSRNTKNGSGLGLSISQKIVERHGGSLYYANEWKDGYKAFIMDIKSAVYP